MAATTHSTAIGSGRQLRALTAPAVIFTVVMIAFPFAYTVWLSLHSVAIGSPTRFNGGANYLALATSDPVFWQSVRVTFVLFVVSLVLQLGAGTWIAMLLYRAKRLPGALRSLLISPFVMPPVVVGMMWLVILDPSIGAANFLLEKIGSAAVAVARLAAMGHSDGGADRYLAVDALCRTNRTGRAAVIAAQCFRGGADRWYLRAGGPSGASLCRCWGPLWSPPPSCVRLTCCASSTSSTSPPRAGRATLPPR